MSYPIDIVFNKICLIYPYMRFDSFLGVGYSTNVLSLVLLELYLYIEPII